LNEADSIRRFVREALPLLSSYFYGEQVLLEPTDLMVGNEGEDEYKAFRRFNQDAARPRVRAQG
jgi:hypothetical protein